MENEPTTNRSQMDLIRRSDVLNKVVRFPNYSENGESVDSYVVFDDDVMSIPAVDAAEVRHARWLRLKDGVFCGWCTFGWKFMTGVPGNVESEYRYCPYCGARMDGEEEHNAKTD